MSQVGNPARGQMRRRRRSGAGNLPSTPGQKIYDYILLGLMIPGSLGAVFVFGGTVGWVGGPFMILTFLAAFLYFLRPTFFPEYRVNRGPVTGYLWLVIVAFVFFRLLVQPLVPYATRIELLHLLSYISAFWVWSELGRSHRRWRWLLILAIVLVTLTAWYALILHVQESRAVLWQERPIDYGVRASATYICPNHFAHLLVVIMCFSIALVANPAAGFPLRFVAGYALIVMAPALFLTYSRAGAIGLAAGGSLVILLLALRHSKMRFFWTSVVLPVILAISFFALLRISPEFQSRAKEALSGNVRSEIWADTVAMIEAKPLLGHGPGTYQWYIGEFRENYKNTGNYVRYAHNEFLHIIAEYGVVGFALYVGVFGYLLIWLLVRMMKSQSRRDAYLCAGCMGALVGSLVHAIFDFNFHIFANVHMLVFLIGLALAVIGTASDRPQRKVSPLYRWFSLPVALLCLLCAGMAVQWTAVSWLDRKINHLLFETNEMESFSENLRLYCGRSLKLDPGYSPPNRYLADDFRALSYWNLHSPDLKNEQLIKAIGYYEKALDGNARDPDAQYGLLKCREMSGDLVGAEDGYRELIRQNPTRSFYRVQYGLFLKSQQQYKEALRVFQAALERDPMNRAINVNIRLISRKLLDNPDK